MSSTAASGYSSNVAEGTFKTDLVDGLGISELGATVTFNDSVLASSWPASMARKKYEPPASPVIRPSPPGSPLWPCDDAHKEKFLKDCEDLDAEAFALDPLDEEGSRAGGAEEDDEYDLRFHLAGFEDKAEDSVEATVSEPVKAAAQDGTRLAVPQGRSRSGSGHIIEEHHIEMGESPRLQSALEMVAEAARTRPRRGTM